MKKLKDLCLSVLINEGEEVISISPSEVGKILDVNFDSEDIRLDFETSYGKKLTLVVKVSDFKKWMQSNKNKLKNIFRYFIIDFLSNSSEGDESLNEIIDDNGNIIGDDDMPNNSTNSMVTSPKFDLEKIYKTMIPKGMRFFSGNYGLGFITW